MAMPRFCTIFHCNLQCLTHTQKKTPKSPIQPMLVLTTRHRCYYYGRPLSVSRRPCYILPMFVFIYFFYGRLILRPWWTEVRESFTRGGPWVSLKKLLLGFFSLVILKLQGGPKSDEISHIFRPRPQTFCSHARTRQNIVILKKTC